MKKADIVVSNGAKQEVSLFSNKRKPIINSYNGYENTRRYVKKSKSYFTKGKTTDISSFENGSYLDPYFKNPADTALEAGALSRSLYATNRIYQGIIDYLVGIYYWRTVVVPRPVANINGGKAEYMKWYHKMIEVVDGFNVKIFFPYMLKQIFLKGRVFLYAFADKKSKSVSMILLPNEYCISSVATQYGTTQVLFDFSFFDSVASSDAERNMVFDLFPEEFRIQYQAYKASKESKFLPLDPRFSTCISMNDEGFPTFLSIFYDIIDYRIYKMNELDRNTNTLERLVTHEIDLEKTGMELPEVEELHADIAQIVNGNGTTLVTSVGTLKVQQLQEEIGQENKALANSYKSIYDNAGFNNALFSGTNAESLKASIKRDLNFVWNYIEQIVNFYNLAANNLFKFGPYQLSFRVLPISPYDEKEKLEMYRANASLGVSVVDFIVASGTPQVDLESTLELEENLNLVSRLMPLQSSHTQSGSATDKVQDTEPKKDEEENIPVEDNEVEVSNKE